MFHQASPILIAGLLAGLLGLCSCVHRPIQAPPPPDELTESLQPPAQLEGGIFTVEAHIGGLGPFRLFLDTGASWTVISTDVAEQLKRAGALTDIRDGKVNTAAGKRHLFDFVELTQIELGEFRVPTATAFVGDFRLMEISTGQPIDGFVGMDLFRSSLLVMDYPNGQLRMEPLGVKPPTNSFVLPARFPHFTPLISLEIGGTTFDMMLDTGSGFGFSIPERASRKLFQAKPVVVGHAVTASGVSESKEVRMRKNLHFGGLTFEQPIVNLVGTKYGSVGVDVLQHFTLGINQRQGEIWLLPDGNQPVIQSPPVKNLGVTFIRNGEVLHITHVLPGSDARKAGLRRGDAIIRIDDTPIANWSESSLANAAHFSESFLVEIRRGTEVRRIRLNSFTAIE